MTLACEECHQIVCLNVLPCLHVLCNKCMVKPQEKGAGPEKSVPESSSVPCKKCMTTVGVLQKCTPIHLKCGKQDCPFIDKNSVHMQDHIQMTHKNCCELQYCLDCEVVFCLTCELSLHNSHKVLSQDEVRRNKNCCPLDTIEGMSTSYRNCKTSLTEVEGLLTDFNMNVEDAQNDIEKRAHDMIAQITAKKNALLQKLEVKSNDARKKYEEHKSYLKRQMNKLENGVEVLRYAFDGASLQESVLLNNLSYQLVQLQAESLKELEVVYIKFQASEAHLDIPLDKRFGDIVIGRKQDRKVWSHSYPYSIPCPIAVSVCNHGNIAICGKSAPHDRLGFVMSYNKLGTEKFKRELKVLPLDCMWMNPEVLFVTLWDNTIAVLDNEGKLKVAIAKGFNGGGKMAVFRKKACLYITSSKEKTIIQMEVKGNVPFEHNIILAIDFFPDKIAVSPNGLLVVNCAKSQDLLVLSTTGEIYRRFNLDSVANIPSTSLTSICFDGFGNLIMIAYAVTYLMHLGVHKDHAVGYLGPFLGRSVANGIVCPAAMTIDPNDNLVVCEGNGSVKCFVYMNTERRA